MRFFQPLLRSTRVRKAVVLVGAAPFAYEIREKLSETNTSISDVLFPIAHKQRVEKQWTMSGSSSTSHRINSLKISTPGVTYVSLHTNGKDGDREPKSAEQQVGAIRVSADKAELLECIEVVQLPPNGIEIRFKKDSPAITGHLLTEVTLAHAAQVNDLEASGGGVVVVEDSVLVSDCAHAQLKVHLRGRGELFVATPSSDLHVKKLVLSVTGSGKLQFDAASVLAVDDVLLQVAGTGRIDTFAKKLHAPLIKSSIAGAGHVSTCSAALSAHKLKSSVAGYGEVTHVGPGHADIQRVSITGSGQVESRRIVSDSATVRVIGSGQATLDVKESLEATCKGSGVVRYVGTPPKDVKTSSLSLEKERAAVKRGKDQEPVPKSSPLPAREEAFDDVSVVYDPKAARHSRGSESFDVFGAIDAFKNAFSGRGGCKIHIDSEKREDHDSEKREGKARQE